MIDTCDRAIHVKKVLSHGAEAYGFRGALWTRPRVRKVIEWEFGVRYHRSHVGRLLKELNWTPQQPVERALQRDEQEITRWRDEIWSETKKKPVWSVESLFLWMNPAFTSCLPQFDHMRLVELCMVWIVFIS